MTETFYPEAELAAVREKRAMKRRRTYRRSKLEKYRSEIIALKEAGASAADIVEWLRSKRCKIHRSSVDRFLASGKIKDIQQIEEPAPETEQPKLIEQSTQRVLLSPLHNRH